MCWLEVGAEESIQRCGNGTIWVVGFIDNNCSSPGERTVTLSSQSVHPPQALMETQHDPERANFPPKSPWNTAEIEASTNSVKIQQEGSWNVQGKGKYVYWRYAKQIVLWVGWLPIHPPSLDTQQAKLAICYQFQCTDCLTYAEQMYLLSVTFDIWIFWTGFFRIPHFLPA